jgi:hypothetical protein
MSCIGNQFEPDVGSSGLEDISARLKVRVGRGIMLAIDNE